MTQLYKDDSESTDVVESDVQDPYSDREILKRICKVALPNYPGQIVGRCTGLVSAALVGYQGNASQLAALALCNVVCNITGFSWLSGLATGISTLSSQSWGAKSYRAVGINLQRGFLILLFLAVFPLLLLWLFSAQLLIALHMDADVAMWVGIYTKVRAPGIFFETLNTVVSRTLSSIGNTTINMYVGIFTTLLNITLNFLLIPHIGFVGAAITVVACDAAQATGVCLLAWRDADFRKCWHGFSRDAWKNWGRFLKLSCPSLWLQNIEWWSWDLHSVIAGLISTEAQATQAMAPQITDLQYAVGNAFGVAATTVTGNLLGEDRPEDARRASVLLMRIVLGIMTCQVGLFISLRYNVPYWFTKNEVIINNIIRLYPLTLAFSFMDGHQAALTGILTGAGKQIIAAPIIFVCYWIIGLPFGILLAFGKIGTSSWGLEGLWTGMLVAVICHTLAFALCVCKLNWSKIAADVRARTLQEQQRSEAGTSLVEQHPFAS